MVIIIIMPLVRKVAGIPASDGLVTSQVQVLYNLVAL